MKNRVALGVAGGLLLAIGLAIGVIVGPGLQALAAGGHPNAAAANTPTPAAGAYCQLYIQTVSKDLGVNQSQLQSANKDALQAVINKMYADGKISQAQKTSAEQELTQYASDPCAAIAAMASHKGAGSVSSGAASQALSGARSALLTAVAGALHISSASLQSELNGGKTVAQVISEKGASKSAVNAAYLSAAQGQLNAAVKAGTMTQAQSTSAYSFLQQIVASGHYPLLDRGGDYGAMAPAGMFSPAGMPGPAGMMWGN
ncbi:MAG TPA: hypothetical protein VF725_02430 [Ktedonobacterales bacterium]|jgi:hypothetical protein